MKHKPFGWKEIWFTGLAVSLALIFLADESARAQTFTVLYTFTGGSDGGEPDAGVIRDAQGNLYGTTVYSGDLSCVNENGGSRPGCGVAFKLDATGNETALHTFIGTDGALPEAPLIPDSEGNLYGNTARGGTYGWGTVFKVDTSGNETVLHSFNGSDGAYPYLTSLVMDKKGNLYGTTYQGGVYGYGTVFKLSPSGQETVLHSFAGGETDGCYPIGTPAIDSSGNFYGTTNLCGFSNLGTVWKLSKNGIETVLHNFNGSDGEYPYAGVILDKKGNLFGTAGAGGTYNYGTIYQLNKKNAVIVLHSFAWSEGAAPSASMTLDANGNLYGTALIGGSSGSYGTVFELTPPSATATKLTSSPNPSTYGQSVAFTATVTSSTGAPPDGETVSFMKGKTVLGTGSLSGGSASFAISTLRVGTTSVTALYGGDPNLGGSKSNTVKQVVEKSQQ